jgi:hypothetical protein
MSGNQSGKNSLFNGSSLVPCVFWPVHSSANIAFSLHHTPTLAPLRLNPSPSRSMKPLVAHPATGTKYSIFKGTNAAQDCRLSGFLLQLPNNYHTNIMINLITFVKCFITNFYNHKILNGRCLQNSNVSVIITLTQTIIEEKRGN